MRNRKRTSMEKVLLLITAASGLCAISFTTKRQYHFVYDRTTWAEALSYCRKKYTDLATVENIEDVKTLNKTVDWRKIADSEGNKRAWIGLYDDVKSWRWSMSDKNGETAFQNWYSGQPNNEKSQEHCVHMYGDGSWNDNACGTALMAVCSDVRGPSVTFSLTKKSMTWTEAQSYCRAHHTDLATVRSMSENQKIQKDILKGQSAWIGLYRDSWKWMDGSISSFRYWTTLSYDWWIFWTKKVNEPNNNGGKENCVAANFDLSGTWGDWNCDLKKAFICYSVPAPVPVSKQVVRLKLKENSSLDLNDPAVMEDMLRQLKQKLKDQGINGDIKLSWRTQSDGKVFHKEKEAEKKNKTTLKNHEL